LLPLRGVSAIDADKCLIEADAALFDAIPSSFATAQSLSASMPTS
jgi:hypothetical protein